MTAKKVPHTPAPWKVVAAEFKGKGIVAYEIRMPNAEISKANAELIEAAPDLLTTLAEILEMPSVRHTLRLNHIYESGCRCQLCRAEKVISNATGYDTLEFPAGAR